MNNTNFEQFKKDFKQDMLIKVIVALRHKKISQENASYMAKRILEIFQEEKVSDTFKKINKLAESHPNILEILIKRGTEYDERQRAEDISQIQIYLKAGSAGPDFSPSGSIRTRLEERSMADLRKSKTHINDSLTFSKGGDK
jgi:hypothetical protein